MSNLCATVGCNHRRDEHTRVREDGIDWNVCTGDDDCLDFTDPLLLDHDYSLADEIRVGRAELTVAEHYHDSDSVEGWRRGVKRRCTENHAPTVAEHDDNLDLARAEAERRYPHDGYGKSEVQLARLTGLREGYAAAFAEQAAALDAERAKNTEALAVLNEIDDGNETRIENRLRGILGGKDR